MGVAMLESLFRQQSGRWYFARIGDVPGELSADRSYVNASLNVMHVKYSRRGTKKYHGVVGSSWELVDRVLGRARFSKIHSPDWLAELDSSRLDRATVSNIRLLGPRPYIGGDITIQLGLFSRPQGDLSAPFLRLLTSLSDNAGVALLGAATPLVQVIQTGFESFVDDDSSQLEIGVYTTLISPVPGIYALIRSDIKASDVRWEDEELLVSGVPCLDSHIVFTVYGSRDRADWATIPELRESWENCRAAIRAGRHKDVDDALAVFRRAAATSAELLIDDARQISHWAQAQAEKALGASETSSSQNLQLPDLADFSPI